MKSKEGFEIQAKKDFEIYAKKTFEIHALPLRFINLQCYSYFYPPQ